MKKRWFTLVEILLVAAIVVILAGISIPVISRASETGKLHRAAAECNSIQMAIKNFETEMQEMPKPQAAAFPNNGQYVIGEYQEYRKMNSGMKTRYEDFFTMMIGYPYNGTHYSSKEDPKNPDPTEKLPSNSASWFNNTKHINYLSPPASYAQLKGFLDPWEKPYFIVYKTDGDIMNDLNGLYMSSTTALYPKEKLLTPIAVFTREGRHTTNTNKLNDDTVRYATSWEGVKTYVK